MRGWTLLNCGSQAAVDELRFAVGSLAAVQHSILVTWAYGLPKVLGFGRITHQDGHVSKTIGTFRQLREQFVGKYLLTIRRLSDSCQLPKIGKLCEAKLSLRRERAVDLVNRKRVTEPAINQRRAVRFTHHVAGGLPTTNLLVED